MKEKWFFTFGIGQLLRGYHVMIEGTFGEAREKMCEQFGTKWAFQYSEADWLEMPEEYKGQQIVLNV